MHKRAQMKIMQWEQNSSQTENLLYHYCQGGGALVSAWHCVNKKQTCIPFSDFCQPTPLHMGHPWAGKIYSLGNGVKIPEHKIEDISQQSSVRWWLSIHLCYFFSDFTPNPNDTRENKSPDIRQPSKRCKRSDDFVKFSLSPTPNCHSSQSKWLQVVVQHH